VAWLALLYHSIRTLPQPIGALVLPPRSSQFVPGDPDSINYWCIHPIFSLHSSLLTAARSFSRLRSHLCRYISISNRSGKRHSDHSTVPKIMTSNEVYLLPLKDDGSPDVPGGYVYLAPKTNAPITIRFAIEGTSSICRHGSLWVNIPKEGEEFRRDKFQEFK